MADVTLSDGRQIDINLFAVSHAEHIKMAKGEMTAEEDSVILARAFGMTPAELNALPQPDWRRLVIRYWEKSREPLADPN